MGGRSSGRGFAASGNDGRAIRREFQVGDHREKARAHHHHGRTHHRDRGRTRRLAAPSSIGRRSSSAMQIALVSGRATATATTTATGPRLQAEYPANCTYRGGDATTTAAAATTTTAAAAAAARSFSRAVSRLHDEQRTGGAGAGFGNGGSVRVDGEGYGQVSENAWSRL